MVEVVAAYHGRVRVDVFDIVPEQAGRILDFGGGIGATGAALKASGRATHVVLADQVADVLAQGVDHSYAGDLEDLALIERIVDESGPFDTILCLDILEHLSDPWSVVQRLHHGLMPGGALVISLPNVNHWSVVGPLLLKGRFDLADTGVLDRTHLRWFAKHGVIDLATGTGLVLEAIKHNIFDGRKRRLDRMTFGLLTRFLALQYVVRVRRKD